MHMQVESKLNNSNYLSGDNSRLTFKCNRWLTFLFSSITIIIMVVVKMST